MRDRRSTTDAACGSGGASWRLPIARAMISAADRREQDPGGYRGRREAWPSRAHRRAADRRQQGPPVERSKELIAAGQRDFGESRVQEALAKWPALLGPPSGNSPSRNRSAPIEQGRGGGSAIRYDPFARSTSLLEALVKEASGNGVPLVYVQVNIGEEEQKGG